MLFLFFILLQEIKKILLSIQSEARDFSGGLMLKIQKLLDGIQSSSSSESTPESELSNTQKFFMNPKLHRYVDKLVKYVTMMKELAGEAPKFDLLTPEPPIFETNLSGDEADWFKDGFTVDLGADEPPLKKSVQENVGVEEDVGAKDGADGGSKDKAGEENVGLKAGVVGGSKAGEENVGDCEKGDELDDAVKSVSSKVKRVGNDVSSLFWLINDEVGYVSKLVKFNKKCYRTIPQPHMEVVDFCFYDGDGSVQV